MAWLPVRIWISIDTAEDTRGSDIHVKLTMGGEGSLGDRRYIQTSSTAATAMAGTPALHRTVNLDDGKRSDRGFRMREREMNPAFL